MHTWLTATWKNSKPPLPIPPGGAAAAFGCVGDQGRQTNIHDMQEQINKPIFVVGSPRSGTSILTWCLGQHPNIFPVNESTGLGALALALAVCYQTKIGLGPDSLWAAMNV